MEVKDQSGWTPFDTASQTEVGSDAAAVADLMFNRYKDNVIAQEAILSFHSALRAADSLKEKVVRPAGTLTME